MAWPAANSGASAALTCAVLRCRSRATTATIASWPALAALPPLTVADVVCAWAAGVPPSDAATATPLPAATAALTAAAAAIILVRVRM